MGFEAVVCRAAVCFEVAKVADEGLDDFLDFGIHAFLF